MTTTAAPTSAKEQFLDAYEREHQTTMRVLRAFPADQCELQPHPKCKTARDLAWIFVLERGLGGRVMQDLLMSTPMGAPPPAPESWDAVLGALEAAHTQFGDMIRGMSDEQMFETVKFFVGPKTVGDVRRIDFAWFLLSDQIHHRGQFSIYLRMADAKVPSIYGPSADEPWN
jgi:uncharacterized damage-inducible protein DinB